MIAIDEAHRIFRRTPQPLSGILGYIANMARHRNIGYILVTPRIQQLHGDVIAPCTKYFLFRMMFPRDQDYLSEFIGDIAYKLGTLPNYHFIYFDWKRVIRYKPLKL
jgi:DNA helicase HerA-like ATPase